MHVGNLLRAHPCHVHCHDRWCRAWLYRSLTEAFVSLSKLSIFPDSYYWSHDQAFITKNFKGSIEETLKDPLKKALAEYKDNPSGNNEQAEQAYKNAWNEVQKEVSLNQVLPR